MLPAFPAPGGISAEQHLIDEAGAGLDTLLQRAVTDGLALDADTYRAAPGAGAGRHQRHGLCRLLPDRGRLHRLGARQRRAGRAGPRLRRRLAGGLRARHHAHRSDRQRPAVRALPESGTQVPAGLRRRLLHGRPRPGDRLRGRPLRPRAGVADHHLRLDGGQGGGARRRARARPAVWLRGLDRQADPVRARHHARQGAGAGGRAARALRGRGRRAHADRPGQIARRPGAQRRQARRRRGHRARPADRLRAAVLRSRRRQPGDAVRQGRRRGHRPGEVRLPGPAHADHHRLGAQDPGPARPGLCRFRHRPPAAGRRRRLRPAAPLRDHGGVPARIARHARPDPPPAAGLLRRRGGAGGAVPARSAAVGHGGRLHRPQARPRPAGLPGAAPGAGAAAHLRRDPVPGTGDADRAGAGRLQPGPGRFAAPRHGQEKARGDGQAALAASSMARWPTASARSAPARSST